MAGKSKNRKDGGAIEKTPPAFVHVKPADVVFHEFIGVGQFGSVFRAQWHSKDVAVKKTICFENEAKLLASLSHRHIVTFYGACVEAPDFFLVTEFAENGSLFHFLEKLELIEFDQMISWAGHIAAGMRYLHDGAPERIIHRDLKSLNVLVFGDFTLKICDFGASRAVGYNTVNLSTFAGTVAWMAPEVIRNDTVTEKCDIYSFGVILWELLTMETPYEGMDQYAIIWLVASHGVKLPIPESCPAMFASLLLACWDVSDARPSFKQLVEMLHELSSNDELRVGMTEFVQRKAWWRDEIERMVEGFRKLETDHAKINDRIAALERRERSLEQREKALQLQLHSQALGNQPAAHVKPQLQHATPFRFSGTPTVYNPVRSWTDIEVGSWVGVLPGKLGKYETNFRDNNITGRTLLKLTDSQLKEGLGIKSFGHRQEILEHIRNIEKSADFPPLSPRESKTKSHNKLAGGAYEERKIEFDVVATVTHSKGSHRWEVNLNTVAKDRPSDPNIHEKLIKQVIFNISAKSRQEAKTRVLAEAPFQHSENCIEDDDVMLQCAITYKPLFKQRKTTKVNFKFNCDTDTLEKRATVQLKPKSSALSKMDSLALLTVPEIARDYSPRTESLSLQSPPDAATKKQERFRTMSSPS